MRRRLSSAQMVGKRGGGDVHLGQGYVTGESRGPSNKLAMMHFRGGGFNAAQN